MNPKLSTWTISRFQRWQDCPAMYAFEHLPEIMLESYPAYEVMQFSSPAMDRGNAIHESAEQFVKGETRELHDALVPWRQDLKELNLTLWSADLSGTEVMWEFDDGWFPTYSGTPWHRAKLDVWYVLDVHATVIDYKSGQVYAAKHADAMDVYAIDTFAMFDDVERVTTQLWYIDLGGDPITKEYTRDKIPRLARRWESRAEHFLSDRAFKPRPGPQCSRCPFSSKANKKGKGPCPY